jgi:hypothetical protein
VVLAWTRIYEKDTLEEVQFECTPEAIMVPDQANARIVALTGRIILLNFVRSLNVSHPITIVFIVKYQTIDVFVIAFAFVGS